MQPTIRVLEFKQEYNAERQRFEDWVLYAPVHATLTAQTWERVDRLKPPDTLKRDQKGLKARHMHAIWSMIGPAYEAWKSGQEIPETGTPLGVWPGINRAQADVLRRAGIRTVEEVQAMTDAVREKVQLPNTRELQRQAGHFLESRDGAAAAQRLTKLEEQNTHLQERLEAAMSLLEQQQQKPKRGRPKKAEAASESEAA